VPGKLRTFRGIGKQLALALLQLPAFAI